MIHYRLSPFLNFLRVIRIHQWSKNFLLFVPLLAAHQVTNSSILPKLFVAFFSFSLCASSVYIINDLIDLEYDRQHPIKMYRPFAAGEFLPRVGVALVPILLVISAILGFWVRNNFLAILFVYFIVTCVYSVWLKKIAPADCMALAVLYTLRIIAGAVVVQVPLSFWLLTFSYFIFLSLANLKRYAELQLQSGLGKVELDGRGYTHSDAALVRTIGMCSGITSSLVLALYLQGDTVTTLYSQPEFIWAIVPLILFWINLLWVKADRGQIRVDPLDYALRDKTSVLVGLLILLCFLLASNGISF
jgi:4-hydroxybenzoate polyprenyltransferase